MGGFVHGVNFWIIIPYLFHEPLHYESQVKQNKTPDVQNLLFFMSLDDGQWTPTLV